MVKTSTCLALYFLLLQAALNAQSAKTSLSATADLPKELFESDEVLEIKITGNIRELLNDRGENPQYHTLTFSYTVDSIGFSFPARLKTRGHFRKDKSNCSYPPLWINFAKKDQSRSSLFYGQDKIKLVMPCVDDDYVIREWLVYKLYNLITPKSFRARLVKVTFDDVPRKKQSVFFGILLEEESKMAKRNKLVPVSTLMVRPEKTETQDFLTMSVFEYMIGNTDWSVQYLQNIKLAAKDSLSIPVTIPYDFDHSGIVNAPYARPAEELELTSVRERRYRGYCVRDMKWFDPVFALFNRLKKNIYETYTACSLLDARYLKAVTKYLDDFYATINNPKTVQKEMGYPCDPNGTGNIVIKGLRTE